jgi:cytochrome b subunit of formate dehydrogenase
MRPRAGLRILERVGFALVLAGAAPLAAAEPPVCSDCHEVDLTAYKAAVHGALECTDCHQAAAAPEHEAAAARRVDCSTCHDAEAAAWSGSAHGKPRNGNAADAPGCTTCHGAAHTLRAASDPESPVHPTRLAETCGTCHANPELVARHAISVARPLEAYRGSVHARAVANGQHGATCSDCHDSHAILPGSNPASTVARAHVPATCGACHGEIAKAYAGSVHGEAATRGIDEAPVCTDCHGEHRILGPQEPGSPVYATNIPLQTCGRCHSDLKLSEKFGLNPDKVPAYEDSYHGLASRSGVTTVAHCASCHGVHDILPSSDPRSHVNPARMAETCGQCHPGAGTRFALGPVHVVASEREFRGIYLIRFIYLPLIVLTIGGMLLHNLLDLIRKAGGVHHVSGAARRGPAAERMSRGFRLAHGSMMVSFPILVVTGFALTYPDAFWSRPLLHWESSLGLRGVVHRTAALLLTLGFLFHLVHLAVDRRARACIAAMAPRLIDVHEFRERMAFYLGRRSQPPLSPALGYVEKSEYLALIWGTLVMMATGFLLWFDNLTLRFLPKWVADAATAIHFYEAVLASLAILVWHLYWVIFDPVVYPMDMTWLTGRSPAAREHERAASPPPRRGVEPGSSPGDG